MNKPLGDDVVECQKPNGEKRWVKYDKKTQEFMVLSPDKKTIITYYYKNLDSRTFANNLRSFLSNCQETRR